jgi:outer membrane protein assembly factor BamD
MRSLVVTGLALVLVASACGDGADAEETTTPRRQRTSGGESGLEYGEEARSSYERALLEFRRGNCIKAEPAFQEIRREYPYSRFAALSELRIGDCQFKDKSYAEAIETYRTFVRYRPSHAQVPYARFRIAEAHYKQIPREWFLSPPTHERDQTPANQALRYLRRFARDFPADDRIPQVNEMIERTLGVLARHELYGARFYRRLDADGAAIRRLEILLERYDGSGHEAEALLLLGELREDIDQAAAAREAYAELVTRFPESEEAGEARERLRSMPAPATPTPAAESEADAEPEPEPEPEAEADSEPEPEPESDSESDSESESESDAEADSESDSEPEAD